jgi:hypothetical protein
MTNYGALAILRALPQNAPARQLRILIAVETFKSDSNGWRRAGQVLLAETANMSISTLKRGRPELIDAKLLEYEHGLGRGALSRYRLNIANLKKGPQADPLSGQGKGSTDGDKRVHPPGQKGSTGKTGKPRNAAGQAPVSGDQPETPALRAKALALKAEGFSSARDRGAAPDGAPRSQPPTPYRVPPCPECGKPFRQEQLADPDFRQMALAGDVIHGDCSEASWRCRGCGAGLGDWTEDEGDSHLCASCRAQPNVVPVDFSDVVRPSTRRRREQLRQRIITVIRENPGLSGRDLEARIGGNREVLLGVIRKLAAAGTIRREQDPADGRKFIYHWQARHERAAKGAGP